jgi:hypothetical protein
MRQLPSSSVRRCLEKSLKSRSLTHLKTGQFETGRGRHRTLKAANTSRQSSIIVPKRIQPVCTRMRQLPSSSVDVLNGLRHWITASTSFTRPFEGTSTPLTVQSKNDFRLASPRLIDAIATGIFSNDRGDCRQVQSVAASNGLHRTVALITSFTRAIRRSDHDADRSKQEKHRGRWPSSCRGSFGRYILE